MSISIMSGVFRDGPDVPLQRLVLLSLADQAGIDGGMWLDLDATAARCAISPAQAAATVRDLRALGLLTGSEIRPVISTIRMGGG